VVSFGGFLGMGEDYLQRVMIDKISGKVALSLALAAAYIRYTARRLSRRRNGESGTLTVVGRGPPQIVPTACSSTFTLFRLGAHKSATAHKTSEDFGIGRGETVSFANVRLLNVAADKSGSTSLAELVGGGGAPDALNISSLGADASRHMSLTTPHALGGRF
jgi:hypothetical protein